MEQTILTASEDYKELDQWFMNNGISKILLVCDGSLQYLNINGYFNNLKNVIVVKFDDFQPNPLYESVVRGVEVFRKEMCDGIIAVGGGSALDVAKCIKLYSNMDPAENYLKQEIVPNNIPFLAVPTTAGTGSEATRYAVIYFEGAKQSVTDNSIIPTHVLMDASSLRTLPLYQKKSTMMDALCHAIESYWSVNSNDESKKYSRQAIEMILANMDQYLSNDEKANAAMLKAAHISGKAINITQTTAGHAMCYKLTSLYGIAHGHAAALVDTKLFPFMIGHIEKCIDRRGEGYLRETFQQIANAMGCRTPEAAAEKLQAVFDSLELTKPEPGEADFEELRNSVNPVRLKNNPVELDSETIDSLYHQILG